MFDKSNAIIMRQDNLGPIDDINSDANFFPNEDIFGRTYNPLNCNNLEPLLYLNDYNPIKSCKIPGELDEDKNSAKNNEIFFHDNGISKNTEKSNIIVNKVDKLSKTLNNKSTHPNSLINQLTENENKNKKKLGRKRRAEIYDEGSIVHNKESYDNIRLKIKRILFKNILLFINDLLKQSLNKVLSHLNLKKIESSFIVNGKKDKNLEILNMTVGEFFSKDICKKYKKYPRDHNAKIIRIIYEENDENLVEVLNKRIGDMMKIFCCENIENNIFKRFKRLNHYINEIKKNKKENDSYIEKFKSQANNFEENYLDIVGRK